MLGQFIYKIINLTNGKFYVGSTTNTRERFRVHRNRLRTNKHHCAHLQAAWNKYGENSFAFHIIEVVEGGKAFLQEAEDRWLTEWVGKEECYNHGLRSGAPWRGVKKEDHPMYGVPRSDDTKQLLRIARLAQADPRTGTTHTDETKAKISAAKLENPTRAWLGKERSAETKEKISAAQRGVKKAPRVYSADGLARAQESMRRVAAEHPQETQTIAKVMTKFPPEVLGRYDFTEAKYLGALIRIEGIRCKEHGMFSQYSAQLRKGRGCPQCGAVIRGDKKKQEMLSTWGSAEGRANMLAARKKP